MTTLQADALAKALLDMIWQFSSHDGKLSHSFLRAEETA